MVFGFHGGPESPCVDWVKEATPALCGSISVKGELWLAMVNNIIARLNGVNPPLELSRTLQIETWLNQNCPDGISRPTFSPVPTVESRGVHT